MRSETVREHIVPFDNTALAYHDRMGREQCRRREYSFTAPHSSHKRGHRTENESQESHRSATEKTSTGCLHAIQKSSNASEDAMKTCVARGLSKRTEGNNFHTKGAAHSVAKDAGDARGKALVVLLQTALKQIRKTSSLTRQKGAKNEREPAVAAQAASISSIRVAPN